jgi:hypothetical protein
LALKSSERSTLGALGVTAAAVVIQLAVEVS